MRGHLLPQQLTVCGLAATVCELCIANKAACPPGERITGPPAPPKPRAVPCQECVR